MSNQNFSRRRRGMRFRPKGGLGQQQKPDREASQARAEVVSEQGGVERVFEKRHTHEIERAEKWLRQHARDPALLLALGKLCMRQALWGKAQSYIEASLALEPTHDGHMTLAALMERIGKPQEADKHFRRSAQLAG